MFWCEVSITLAQRVKGARLAMSGHKLKDGQFCLNTFFCCCFIVRVIEHWNGLPRNIGESPSLEIVKTQAGRT